MQPKFYTKQQTLGTQAPDNFASGPQQQIVVDRYAPITFRMLDKVKDVKKYELAQRTYKVMYNNIQFRSNTEIAKLYFPGEPKPKDLPDGAEPIELTSLMGKPILLTPNNLNPLISEEYYVSTKADGLRFLLLLSNDEYQEMKDRGIKPTEDMQFTANKRFIFFLDSRLNFWTIETSNKAQEHMYFMGMDKLLIDGEILFFADKRDDIINTDTKQVEKIVLSMNKVPGRGGRGSGSHGGVDRPYVIFLAFDILFGPKEPLYAYEKHPTEGEKLMETKKINDTYVLKTDVQDVNINMGSSNNMLGFKALQRWPTIQRRLILQQMFVNTCSPLHAQLKRISDVLNFTIILSPFMSFDDVISADNPYAYAKEEYSKDIDRQFTKMNGFSIFSLNQKGMETDGFIITPVNEDYLEGTWSFGNNKQYKWKPIDEMTIDVLIKSSDIKKSIQDNTYLVPCYTRKSTKPYEFDGSKVMISILDWFEELVDKKDPIVVECSHQNNTISKDHIFTVKQLRLDKGEDGVNTKLTADSHLDQLVGPASEHDILNMVKQFRLYHQNKDNKTIETSMKDEIKKLNKDLFSILSKDSIKRIGLIEGPMIYLSKTKQDKYIDNMLNVIAQRMSQSNSGSKKQSYELEGRIDFDFTENRDLEQLLIKKYLKDTYLNTPMVRLYKDKDRTKYRVTFIELAPENLVLQEVSSKKEHDLVEMPTSIYEDVYKKVRKFNMSLGTETMYDNEELLYILNQDSDSHDTSTVSYDKSILEDIKTKGIGSEYTKDLMSMKKYKQFKEKIEKEGIDEKTILSKYIKKLLKELKNQDTFSSVESSVTAISKDLIVQGTFQYQSRHIINSASEFWSIEIIKYGTSDRNKPSYKSAYESYDKGPNVKNGLRTRIELEYKPLEYYSDILNNIEYFGKEVSSELINKFMHRFKIENELKNFNKLTDKELFEICKKALNKEKNKIADMDPKVILEDYLKVVFDMLYSIYYS